MRHTLIMPGLVPAMTVIGAVNCDSHDQPVVPIVTVRTACAAVNYDSRDSHFVVVTADVL